MSDSTLHRVLNTPSESWPHIEKTTRMDQQERYSRYIQASSRIKNANALIRESFNRLIELESHGHVKMTDEYKDQFVF